MLLQCAAYTEGKKVADIPIDDISEWLKDPKCFVWVAVKDPTDDELECLKEEFDLHELAVEDARHGHQRPKLEEFGKSLFVVMQLIDQSPEGKFHIGELDAFVGPQYVVSVRRDSDQSFAEVRRRSESEPELTTHGPAFVLYALMDTVVDRYVPVLDRLRDDFEEVEKDIFGGQTTRAQIEQVYSLKQKLMTLDHAVMPMIEVAGKLHGGRVPSIAAGLPDYFRDVYDHLLRLKQQIDNLNDTLTTAVTVSLSLITIQETEVTKRLAAYAALIAVPTAIAGVYGMNFKHMPELEWAFGYPAALVVMILLDAYLVYRFRKANWL